MSPTRLWRASALLIALEVCSCATGQSSSTAPAPEEPVSRPIATPEVSRGEQLLVEGRVSEAKQAFERAIADDANDARAWLDLGLTREAMSDYAAAEEAYREATRVDARFAEAFNNLGVLLRERGDLPGAIGVLERAVALDPRLVAARFNLGLAYEDEGRFDDAERAYLIAIEQLPADPVPRVNLAMMYLDADRIDEALSQLRAARDLARGDVLLSIAIGEGLRRAGSPTEAVAVLEAALEQSGDPPATGLLAELALAHYAEGDVDAAERTMRRAVAQDEIDPALQYAYGSILAKQGALSKARSHLRRAISLDPGGPYAAAARKRLDSLK